MKKLIPILLSLYVLKGQQSDVISQIIQEGDFTLSHGPDMNDDSKIWFELSHTGSDGWVALAAGQLQYMANMDIMRFAYINDEVKAIDQSVLGISAPTDDTVNNIELDDLDSYYDPETKEWRVVFARKFDTEDEKDVKFVCGENAISLGYGSNHENSIHAEKPTITSMYIGSEYKMCEEMKDDEEMMNMTDPMSQSEDDESETENEDSSTNNNEETTTNNNEENTTDNNGDEDENLEQQKLTSEYEKEEDNKIKDSKSDSFSSVLMSSMFAILMISLLLA